MRSPNSSCSLRSSPSMLNGRPPSGPPYAGTWNGTSRHRARTAGHERSVRETAPLVRPWVRESPTVTSRCTGSVGGAGTSGSRGPSATPSVGSSMRGGSTSVTTTSGGVFGSRYSGGSAAMCPPRDRPPVHPGPAVEEARPSPGDTGAAHRSPQPWMIGAIRTSAVCPAHTGVLLAPLIVARRH
jgi:hypothetical protein